MLADLADFLVISRGDAAQLVIAIVGAFATTGAALAAWRSAAATQASVKEMSSARHQSVRPLLRAAATEKILLRWGRDEQLTLVSGSDRSEESAPAVTLTNIGSGIALDVSVQLASHPRHLISSDDEAILNQIFKDRGFEVSYNRERNSCSVTDESFESDRFRDLSAYLDWLGYHHSPFPPVNPGESLVIPIRENSAKLLLLDTLVAIGSDDASRRRGIADKLFAADSLTVTYTSLSGEQFKSHFWLVWSSYGATFYGENGRRLTDKLPLKWDQVELRCHVSLVDLEKVSPWHKRGEGGEFPRAWRGSALPKPP